MSCLYNFAFTNNDLKNISACLVSPFGFAALHDFNCAETEEGNHKKEQLRQMIQDYYPQYLEIKSPTEEQFQTACEKAYLYKHTADSPKGVYHCLFHILYSTGFLVKPYVYSKEQAEKENELLKERLSAARKAIQGKEKIKKDYLDSIKWTDIVTKGKWIHKADYDRTLSASDNLKSSKKIKKKKSQISQKSITNTLDISYKRKDVKKWISILTIISNTEIIIQQPAVLLAAASVF